MQTGETVTMVDPIQRTFPGLLPTVGFVILYFTLQVLFTGIIIAATQDVSLANPTPMPIAIIYGLVASAIVQLFLMWLYLRRNDRMALLGLNDFGKIPLHKATGLAILLVIAAMAFNLAYATYVIPGIGMQEEMAKILAGIARTPFNMAAMFFAIAIAAPVVEELLFAAFCKMP